MKKHDSKSDFFDVVAPFMWSKYKKKCKHCGKFNTYRMKKTEVNFDFAALSQAGVEGIEHIEKRYVEIVEAKN